MIAVVLASVLAVSAMQDTTTTLPGTALRFGMESGRFGAAQGFQPAPRPQTPGQQERKGELRFFGIAANATLSFMDRRLVQAEFVIENASPQQISYIEDDLVRRGYRRECLVRERNRSQCTWTGATRVELNREDGRIAATVRLLTPTPPRGIAAEGTGLAGGAAGASGPGESVGSASGAGRTEPGGAGLSMPMHPDTLDVPPGWMREDYLVEPVPAPVYPEAARDAGVQGVVRLLARVDTTGRVTDVRITRSIAELDSAAVTVVRGMRYRPFVHEGRHVGAWVRVPVRFTIH